MTAINMSRMAAATVPTICLSCNGHQDLSDFGRGHTDELNGITLGPPSLNTLELQGLHHYLPLLTLYPHSFMRCIVVLTYSLA